MIGEYQKLNNITKRTATRDLSNIVKRSIFRSIGKGRRELKYILILGHSVPKKWAGDGEMNLKKIIYYHGVSSNLEPKIYSKIEIQAAETAKAKAKENA